MRAEHAAGVKIDVIAARHGVVESTVFKYIRGMPGYHRLKQRRDRHHDLADVIRFLHGVEYFRYFIHLRDRYGEAQASLLKRDLNAIGIDKYSVPAIGALDPGRLEVYIREVLRPKGDHWSAMKVLTVPSKKVARPSCNKSVAM